MLAVKGMQFPIEVILVCIRWYAAYPLSCRYLEEMMEERGEKVTMDKSGANKAAIDEINANREIPMVVRQVKYSIMWWNKIIEQ